MRKVSRTPRAWSLDDIELAGLGDRWVRGETIQALAREAALSPSTLYARLLRAGFSLPEEQAFRRAGGVVDRHEAGTLIRAPEDDPLLAKLRKIHPGVRA